MDKVPVAFEYQGKRYSGTLEQVKGMAAEVWHLMIDHYYYGRLRTYKDNWVFDPAKDEWLKEYAEYFGNIVTGWRKIQDEV